MSFLTKLYLLFVLKLGYLAIREPFPYLSFQNKVLQVLPNSIWKDIDTHVLLSRLDESFDHLSELIITSTMKDFRFALSPVKTIDLVLSYLKFIS